MQKDCIFCKIINKEIPAKIVFENSKVLAFHDINPLMPIHVLIIPKEHIESIKSLSSGNISIVEDLHLAAIEIAKMHNIEDFRLISNCGKSVGQSVFHLHYHLLGGSQIQNLV